MTRTRFFSTIIPTLSASQTATVKPKISQTNIYPHFRTAHTLCSPIQPVPTYFSSAPKVYISPMSTSIASTQRSLHTHLADPKVNMVKSLVKKIFLNPK